MMSLFSFLRRPAVLSTLQFLLLWSMLFSARFFLFDDFVKNETDVLPSALQSSNPDWLPNDWYLNLDIGYRTLFNGIAGPLVSLLGFKYAALVGRALLYMLFAGSVLYFLRTFRIYFAVSILALLPFLNNQNTVAMEWMVGGTETKAFAYAFVLFALSFFYRRKWLAAFAFAGAALSFHVLVGGYALFCAMIALYCTEERRRGTIREVIRNSWPLFLTGGWGLYAIFQQFFLKKGIPNGEAWGIYIQYRVPHHVFPGAWDAPERFAILGAGVIVVLTAALFGRSRRLRYLGYYAIGSLVLFLAGLIIYWAGAYDLLRFYWFRFPDTIIPFLTLMSLALMLSTYLGGTVPLGRRNGEKDDADRSGKLSPARIKRMRILGGAAISLVAILSISRIVPQIPGIEDRDGKGWGDPIARPMLEWIKAHTPHESVMLVSPTMQSFYVQAERAMFVSFKHSPQSAADIVEWYRRLTLCNGGIPPTRGNHEVLDELDRNFYDLDEKSIREISRLYGVTHYLGRPDHVLALPEAHRTSDFILYRIDS